MAFCLPRPFASKFMAALRDGTIDPAKLMDMSSAERRTFFEGIVGAENAEEVNALFESKLLLKDQKAGLVTWARNVAGISEPARRDLLSKISKLDKVLQPADERRFLADLAASKLGVTVTADEAQEIFDLSKVAQDAKAEITQNGWTVERGKAYGLARMDLTDKIESLKPNGRTWGQLFLEAANIPRTAKSTIDLSAPLNQGWGMEASGNWGTAFNNMFEYFGSEQGYRELQASIIGHPDYELIVEKGGLSLTDLGQKLSTREEAIQSTLVEKAFEYGITKTTGIPNLVRASNRAYTGYLNYVRFKTATDMVTAARLAGEDVSLGSERVREITRMINNFSGRGDVGQNQQINNILTGLNAVFFAPRKNVGSVMMLFDPVNWLNPKTSRLTRIKATKMLIGSIVYTGAALGLARALGYKVDLDPRSTEFLKIQAGKTSQDITGGNSTWVRFFARLVTGIGISAKGNVIDYGKDQYGRPFHSDTVSQILHSRANVIWQYMLTKLAPGVPSVYADALIGHDPQGRPFSVTQEMRNQLAPMTIDSFVDFIHDDPGNWAAAALSVLTIFGANMQTMTPDNSGKRDLWGDPNGTEHNDRLDQTLTNLGIKLNPPERTLRGVKLNDQEYDELQWYVGKALRGGLSKAVNTQGFARMSAGMQEKAIRDTARGQRAYAEGVFLGRHTDLIGKANEAKRALLQLGSPAAIARRPQ